MAENDIRWIQRYNNFLKALGQLRRFVDNGEQLSDLELQGLIKSFEYTYELAWNTLKDFYEEQGEKNIQGSRDAIQLAFRRGLIEDGMSWMAMLQDRNMTSHTYDEDIARSIARSILNTYYPLFLKLHASLNAIMEKVDAVMYSVKRTSKDAVVVEPLA